MANFQKKRKGRVETRVFLDSEMDDIVESYRCVYKFKSKDEAINNMIKKYPTLDSQVRAVLEIRKGSRK